MPSLPGRLHKKKKGKLKKANVCFKTKYLAAIFG